MGFLDLFVKQDDSEFESKVTEQKQTAKTAVAPTGISSLSSTPLATTSVVSNEAKNEAKEFLEDIYKKGNFPGPDFQEFADSYKALESFPMDEKTRFNAAYVTLKTQGVTKSRLLDTGGKYIVMINEQSTGFAKRIDEIIKTEVGQKQNNVDALTKENAEIEKQMIALTEKRNRNNELISVATSEINSEVLKYNTKKSSFETAASEFVGRIQWFIAKINEHLPA